MFPGETIRVRGWHEDDRIVAAATIAGEGDRDGAPVLARLRADPRPDRVPTRAQTVTLPHGQASDKLPNDVYEAELYRLQVELVKVQEWAKAEGQRIVIVFEGRDAAGKGGTIKRITQYLNPRVARIVALPAPTDRQRGQWYFQRYVEHLPTRGELALFDRSWYNRGGVERVMGYCTDEEYERWTRQCPVFERQLVEDGILLRKYWFSVSDKEQQKRFKSRLNDPMRQWKLSPTDLESITRWEDYSRAKDEMMVHTDIPEAPWFVVESDDKKRARLNMMAHLLSTIPYAEVPTADVRAARAPGADGLRAAAARRTRLRARPLRDAGGWLTVDAAVRPPGRWATSLQDVPSQERAQRVDRLGGDLDRDPLADRAHRPLLAVADELGHRHAGLGYAEGQRVAGELDVVVADQPAVAVA